jgi:hypothetical protein
MTCLVFQLRQPFHDSEHGGFKMELPGKNVEKAVANAAGKAAKSILKGMGRLGGAALAEWIATQEAKAQAARLAIETKAQIGKKQLLAEYRRQSEIEEQEHRAVLDRRAARLRAELAWEQANLENIALEAIEQSQESQDPAEAREIEDDWMFKFADFAQRVSDEYVQKLWARILTSAATSGQPRLSAASLQTMSLLDREAATHFTLSNFAYRRLTSTCR